MRILQTKIVKAEKPHLVMMAITKYLYLCKAQTHREFS